MPSSVTLVYDRTGQTSLSGNLEDRDNDTIADILSDSWNTYGITQVSDSIGGTPIQLSANVSDYFDCDFLCTAEFYDVSPQTETITGFYLDGTEYKFEGGGGTEYNAGEGIVIGTEHSDMQGPAPSGFHVPLTAEWQGLKTIMDGLGLTTGNNWRINLHIPFVGYRNNSTSNTSSQGSMGFYWSSSPYVNNTTYRARLLQMYPASISMKNDRERSTGLPIRCFKNSFEIPTSSWIVINGTLGSAGIFWNQTDGLISITSDGNTGYTIMDKNLGATTVYSDGDTLSDANIGYYYQWGNNYGFPATGTISNISSTKIDASNYGPNTANGYYESDTFITVQSGDWSSVHNDNLWGGVTQGTWVSGDGNTIINTGVLSVNGQTGNVTIEGGLPEGGTEGQILMMVNGTPTWVTPTAKGFKMIASDSPLTVPYDWYGTEAQYTAATKSNDTAYLTV